jgi:hypothetical protein
MGREGLIFAEFMLVSLKKKHLILRILGLMQNIWFGVIKIELMSRTKINRGSVRTINGEKMVNI